MPPASSDARLVLLTAVLCALLAGCATGKDPRDPLEPVNRSVFGFNETFDRLATKPLAKGYVAAVPPPVRGGVTNFFGNFRDVTTAVNNLFQGKIKNAFIDVGRITVNSTVGFFGVFDVASRIGLEKHYEDFGQTLGVWGVGDGPYLVLPLWGPSSARDAVGLGGDYFTDPEFFLFTVAPGTYVVFGTRAVNARANLLETEQMLSVAALDRYAFTRDAYLQYRRSQIYDGNPPPEPGSVQTGPHRKTLKEMEEELDEGNDVKTAPAAPPKQ